MLTPIRSVADDGLDDGGAVAGHVSYHFVGQRPLLRRQQLVQGQRVQPDRVVKVRSCCAR